MHAAHAAQIRIVAACEGGLAEFEKAVICTHRPFAGMRLSGGRGGGLVVLASAAPAPDGSFACRARGDDARGRGLGVEALRAAYLAAGWAEVRRSHLAGVEALAGADACPPRRLGEVAPTRPCEMDHRQLSAEVLRLAQALRRRAAGVPGRASLARAAEVLCEASSRIRNHLALSEALAERVRESEGLREAAAELREELAALRLRVRAA